MLDRMPRSLLLVLAVVAMTACRAEKSASSIDLLNGKDLAVWEFVAAPATDVSSVCHYNPDEALAVLGKPVGFLATKATYKNYRLHAEWRWPADAAKNSNGGVLLHIASGPKDRAWPLCFQLQTKPTRAGDLLPMAGASFAEKLSTPPEAKTPQLDRADATAEKPLGEWNSCDVLCRDGEIEVRINGVVESHVTHASPDAGKIGFQLEGTPYELRHVTVTPLE